MLGQPCDKCPAHAWVRVDFDTGGCLYFCRHHERTYFGGREHAGVTFTYATAAV